MIRVTYRQHGAGHDTPFLTLLCDTCQFQPAPDGTPALACMKDDADDVLLPVGDVVFLDGRVGLDAEAPEPLAHTSMGSERVATDRGNVFTHTRCGNDSVANPDGRVFCSVCNTHF